MAFPVRDEKLKETLGREGVGSLYLLVGNDSYIISRCLLTIIKAMPVDIETVSFDFCEVSNDIVEQELSSYSFTEKLIVIDNFKASEFTAEKQSLYAELLGDLPETLKVIVKSYSDAPFYKLPKGAQTFAELSPDSYIVTCEKRKGDDLVKYVCQLAKAEGSSMGFGAAKRLIALRGDDLFLLSNEIKKLAAAVGYGEITETLINSMCPKTTEDNVFEFVKAAEAGNVKSAVSIFYDMMEQEQEPLMVLGAISSSYVNIARAITARGERKSIDEVEADFGYKKGDRALAVAFDKEYKFSREKIKKVLDLLQDINFRMTSSAEDRQIIIERGMIELCTLMKRN